MTCPRCRVKMKQERGTHHKQRKFRCPKCGRARMQQSLHREVKGL